MNVLIIEDELLTADDLKSTLQDLIPTINIVKTLHSVKESLQFFRYPNNIDLIFSDIQLGDGLSFEIFKQSTIQAPIIFCTAYDEYALKAFEANGIHYVLKPFDEAKIAEAINKFQNLKASFQAPDDSFNKVIELLQQHREGKDNSILVTFQDKVIPIKIINIALFYIKNEVSHLLTFDGNFYYINMSLDEIQQLCGNDFYRANRQYIVNRRAIKQVEHLLSRKVSLVLNIAYNENILISKEKVSNFMEWLKK